MRIRALALACLAASILAWSSAHAAEKGEVILVDNLGLPLYTHNFDTGKDATVADKLLVSEFMGAHYFITDRIRLGMMVQWTEQYSGELAPGADHFATFALLPQVGWNFYDRFSTALIFTIAPRAAGKAQLDLGIQGLLGYSIPLTQHASLGLAVEVPFNFKLATTIGITPLAGLAVRL